MGKIVKGSKELQLQAMREREASHKPVRAPSIAKLRAQIEKVTVDGAPKPPQEPRQEAQDESSAPPSTKPARKGKKRSAARKKARGRK